MAHYKVDSLKVGYAEYWRIARQSPLVLFVWIPKLLGRRIDIAAGTPSPQATREMLIEPAEIPEDVRKAITETEAELAGSGLQLLHCGTLKDSLMPGVDVYFADFAQPSGNFWTRCFVTKKGTPLKVFRLSLVAFSKLADGRFLVTSNIRHEFDNAPFTVVKRLRSRNAADVVAAHRAQLEKWQANPGFLSYASAQELEPWMDEYERRCFDHALSVGRYVEMTPEEVAAARARKAALGQITPAAGTPGEGSVAVPSDTAPIIRSLEQQLNPKPNWWNTLLIFAGSLVVFAAAGRFKWSPRTLLVLLSVLLFHELGHFAAMKAFGYKNLRMFFIPLFGAAVTGQKMERSGWKKAVVALLGPGPGIVVGFTLAIVAGVAESASLERVAWMLILLNGFNLLPFLPLDGGWVMQALFFSRHPGAEAGFKAFAGVALILISLKGGLILLGFLGAFTLLALPLQFKLAKIAKEIRTTTVVNDPPPGAIFSPELVTKIAGRVRAISAQANPGTIVDMTRAVYEKVAQVPPRWWATLSFMVVYLGLIAVGLLGIGVLVAARADRLHGAHKADSDFVFALSNLQTGTTEDGLQITAALRYPTNHPVPGIKLRLNIPSPGTNLVVFSRSEFSELNRGAGGLFLPGLTAALGEGGERSTNNAAKTNIVEFTAAIMGTNFARGSGKRWVAAQKYTSDRPGYWIVTKAFFGDGDLEFYLAVNPRDLVGIISAKDTESGAGIIQQFERLFDDGE